MPAWNGTVPSFSAGEVPTATKLQTLADMLSALSGAQTAYTPTVSFGGTNWTLGNATVDCSYTQVRKFVTATGRIVVGSTTNFNGGTGAFGVTIPVSARRAATASPMGTAFIVDLSAGSATTDWVSFLASATLMYLFHEGTQVVQGAPFTWAVGDEVRFNALYEAA